MQIGRYRVLGELGRGAMGIVYRAQDPAIGRIIAIKSIRLNEMTDPDERARLRDRLFREAQSAGMLSHPNIVTIYDILEEDGLAYIFMEFVNGKPLDDILRSSELPTGEQLVTLLAQTAHALDYAHKKGIIHRDVKPANVMVHEDSVAKVCDFGIAKITSQSMTQTGVVMGTPSYMSPELIKGETLTGASDQFALAIMAYEILTGQKPYKADYLPTLFFKVCSDEPPAVHDLNPTLNPLVDRAVRKALAKKPEDRYPNCVEFIKQLQRSLEAVPEWTPLAKGPMPIAEESTTSSGGRLSPPPAPPPASPQQSTAPPFLPTTSGGFSSTGSDMTQVATGPVVVERPVAPPPAAVPFIPTPPPPAAAQTGRSLPATPAPQPQAPQPTPSMRIPIRDQESEAPPASSGGTSKAMVAGAALAVLALVGYFGYSKFAAPVETPPQEAAPKSSENPPEVKPSPSGAGGQPTAGKATPPKTNVTTPPTTIPVGGTTPPKPAGDAKDRDYDVAFVSTPAGATVSLDGTASCKSPCSLPLKAGRHAAQFTLTGFVTMFRAVEVPQTLDLTVTLPEATGILAIITTPKGASITIDGQARSEVTPARITLREGSHKVDLVLGALRDSHEVTIKQGGIQQIQSTWQ